MKYFFIALCAAGVGLFIYSLIKNRGKENPPSTENPNKPVPNNTEPAPPAPVEKPKKSFFSKKKNSEPAPPPAPPAVDPMYSSTTVGDIRLTRLGQSSVMIQISDKYVLIDPMLTDKKSESGDKFAKAAVRIAEMPHITAILLTHEHLEPSIYKKADEKVDHYIVPKGVEQHLYKGNIAKEKIDTMSWWQKDKIGDVEFICAPSRNMSGRSLVDAGHEKMCSWIIRADGYQIYDSGDGDYGLHFGDDTQAQLPEKPKSNSFGVDEITASVTRGRQ